MMPNYVHPCQSVSYRIIGNMLIPLSSLSQKHNWIPNTTTRIESIITDKHVFYIPGNIKKSLKIWKEVFGVHFTTIYSEKGWTLHVEVFQYYLGRSNRRIGCVPYRLCVCNMLVPFCLWGWWVEKNTQKWEKNI